MSNYFSKLPPNIFGELFSPNPAIDLLHHIFGLRITEMKSFKFFLLSNCTVKNYFLGLGGGHFVRSESSVIILVQTSMTSFLDIVVLNFFVSNIHMRRY